MSKASILIKLKKNIKKAKILDLYSFQCDEFVNDSKNVISEFLIAFSFISFSLILPATPRCVHIVRSASGVINTIQTPVGNFSFFFDNNN